MMEPLKVIAGAPDHPLVIGDIEISVTCLRESYGFLANEGYFMASGQAVAAAAPKCPESWHQKPYLPMFPMTWWRR